MPLGRFGSWLIATATALVILGGSIVPFATPAYVRLEQDRTNVEALTGFDRTELDGVTTSILGDLFLWQGNFDARLGDVLHQLAPNTLMVTPVLNLREQAHMRDVRGVFAGFEVLVLLSVVVLVLAFRRSREPEARAAAWRAVGNGAKGLLVALVVVAAFALFAFDAAFEVFHELFFPAGSFTFDPRTDRLVQLFPDQFWSETAIAVGLVGIAFAILTAWQATRRSAAGRPSAVLATSRART
jgi:integral membrane protein (TIGR01906 family)